MSQIRVILIGASGKMGIVTQETLSDARDFELVKMLNRGDDVKEALCNTDADVVIDFTQSDCAVKHATWIIEAGLRPVIGTSGLTKQDVTLLQELALNHNVGGVIAPNFSLATILLQRTAQEIAKLLPDVELIEMHHTAKKDAPSGTAIHTAELIAAAKSVAKNNAAETCHEVVKNTRGGEVDGVPVHAVRLPGVVARQQVIFGNKGETLTLDANTWDREAFMPGVLLACQKAMALDHLVYGLSELLD